LTSTPFIYTTGIWGVSQLIWYVGLGIVLLRGELGLAA